MARKLPAVAIGCGVLSLMLLVVVAVLVLVGAFALESGRIVHPDARPAGKIPAGQLRQLIEMGVVGKEEKVLFFYSTAMFNIRGDGNLFTDQRVISYYDTDGIFTIEEAKYEDIAEIDFLPAEGWMDDSTITVTRRDGTWFVLYVSSSSQGDQLFYEKLMEEWAKHKEDEEETDEPSNSPPTED